MIPASKKLYLLFLNVLPGAITLALLLFYLVAKHMNGLDRFMPLLPMIPIFFWGLMQAREMPYWFVFLIGLVMDSISGLPLGLSSLLYIFFLALLHAQRKYIHKEGFIVKWGYFAVLLAVMSSLHWIMLSLFNSRAESFFPSFLQWFFTVCCYPFMHKGFEGLYDFIHTRRWQILHGH